MSGTQKAAEHMLATGRFYSAGLLGRELGISAVDASGKLANIRHAKKYQCVVTALPNRLVKVVAINGSAVAKAALWELALFQRPLPPGETMNNSQAVGIKPERQLSKPTSSRVMAERNYRQAFNRRQEEGVRSDGLPYASRHAVSDTKKDERARARLIEDLALAKELGISLKDLHEGAV